MSTTIGTIELLATIDTSQYKRGAKEIDKANADMESSGDKSSSKLNSAFSAVAKVGLAALATAVVAVGALIAKNIGNAIERVDTLNNSTRTFENMGFGAKEVNNAMKALEQSIRGLPTPLDQAVKGVQLLAGSTNDISKAQQIFTALNNAIIGFGGSAEDVQGAIMQISQAFSNGRIDAQTWNSLIQNNLGPTLNALARQMGITTGALKEGLSDGTISVETFQDALIKLNKEGGGGMKSLEQISKDATSGISTGWQNLNTAITRGIASLIQSVGSERISQALGSIGKSLEGGLKSLSQWIKDNETTIKAFFEVLGQVITGVAAALSKSSEELGPYKEQLVEIGKVIGGTVIAVLLGAVVVIGKAIEGVIFIITQFVKLVAWITETGEKMQDFSKKLWESITGTLGGLVGWFRNLWSNIVGLFGSVGSAVGNAFGNAFRSVVNTIIRNVVNNINSFIRAINGIVGAVNQLPGPDVSRIGELGIPQLAQGGIVTSPTLAMVGEGNEPEAVIPLSKLNKMMDQAGRNSGGGEIHNHFDGIMVKNTSELRDLAKMLVGLIDEERAAKQQPLIMGGMQ